MASREKLTRQGVRDLTPHNATRPRPLPKKVPPPPAATTACHWTEHVYWKRCVCWRALNAS